MNGAMIDITKRSAIVAVILGGIAGILVAVPVPPDWRPVDVAIAALFTALGAVIRADP